MIDAENTTKSRQPKVFIVFLVIVGFLTIGLGFLKLNNYIKTPFLINFQNTSVDIRQALAKIKSDTLSSYTDTDKDGLTDNEELNAYHTSPYLADSDSDGASDYDEVQKGTDPNCNNKTGNCQLISSTSTSPNINGLIGDTGTETDEAALAQIIRQGLLDNGANADDLAKIDDATLIQLYNEVAQENGDANANINLSTNTSKAEMANYSIAQIKQALLAGGFKQTDLDKMTDQQVNSLWQDILKTM
jgi:hypothetical protein